MKKTLLAVLLTGAAWALPENGQVVQGQVQMVQPNANILQILQSSPTGIINWGSFGIGPQQLVQFLQPNSAAATLNRVIGQEPSQILGQLQANGRILLVNPNGILFGPGSVVDTGSFLASTLAIQDQDFLQGRYDLHWDGQSPLRAIVNQGEIRVADGGFLALVSPLLDNQGTLIAERGQVVLGATRQASLTVDARGLLQVVIPDGFGAPAATPGAVLLTPGQMSDTLSALVQHYAPSEAGAIVDTGHGIQLTAGEGLLLNQGSIRAEATRGDAGSILLNSSQATVLAPGSLTSARSQAGNGGEIRVLSADYVRQQGVLQASSLASGNGGFVEVSAPHVAMTRGADVSALQGTAGVFLLDPDNVFIRNGGPDAPNQPFGSPGDGDIAVDPTALNVTGTVTLQANQSIIFDAGVQVNLDGDTDLVLQAKENIIMNPNSAIHATDPGASVTMDALLAVDVTTLQIATSHIKAGTFARFNGGILGLGGSPSLVNVSAASVSFADGSVTDMHGSDVDFNSVTTGDFLVGDNARFELLGSSSNNATIGAAGVGLNTGSMVLAAGTGNSLNFQANTGSFNMGPGSTISAAGAGSVLNVTAAGAVDLRKVVVPNIRAEAGTFARFDGGQMGAPNQATNVNVTADRMSFLSGSTTEMIGTDVNVTLTANSDFQMETDSRWDLNGTSSQKAVVDAGTSLFWDDNSRLTGTGPTELVLTAGTFFDMNSGSSIVAENSASSLDIHTGTSADMRDLRVPHLDVDAGTFARFKGATVGAAGSDTLVSVTAAHGVAVFAGTTLDVLGQNVQVDLLATGDKLEFGQDSLVQLSGSTSNLLNARSDHDQLFIGENTRIHSAGPANLHFDTANNTILQRNGGSISIEGPGNVSMSAGVNVIVQGTSSVNATGAGSRLDVHAGTEARMDGNARVPIVNVTSDGNLQFSGALGRSGGPTRIDGTAGNITLFSTEVSGSQVDWNLHATTDSLIEAAGSHIQVGGSGNHLHWTSLGNTELGSESSLSAAGPTQLLIQAGGRFLQFANSTIRLSDEASYFDLSTGFSPLLNRVEVGGRVAVTASGGNNIRIADQVVANEVILTSPGQLLDDRTDATPAIVAQNSLNVTVANISGPLTDPNIGLVNATPFATGPNARVRFNLTGPNNTTLGNRSANLYYAYPQSGDVSIVHPGSDVALYNEPPPPQTAARGIETRQDLSAQAFQELTYQAAQAQVQLSSLYSVADLPASDSVLLLQYDNSGLTDAYSVSYMTSALVERVVLSPEQVMRARFEREKRGTERPTSLLVTGNDEDEQTLYWRRLIEGIILWEE